MAEDNAPIAADDELLFTTLRRYVNVCDVREVTCFYAHIW